MVKKISILGCGWLGYPLAQHWTSKGHVVKGSSRSAEKLFLLEKNGIDPYALDIEKMAESDEWARFLESEILVIAIPNKNTDAHRQFANMVRLSGIKQIIYTSSTSVYLPTESPVIETSALKKENPLRSIEQSYQESDIPTCILRLSGLVGPDRHPGGFFRRKPKASLSRVPINLIHQNDVIQVMDKVINNLPSSEIFNVTSVEHPPKFDFYSKAYEAQFGEKAKFELSQDNSAHKKIGAQKLLQLYGLKFSLKLHYPTLFAD